MESKFKYSIYLLLFLITTFPFLIYNLISLITFSDSPNFWSMTLLIALFTFLLVWLSCGELRTKAVSLKINNKSIIIKNYLGFGNKKEFNFKYFDSYVISDLNSRGGIYEYTYLIKDEKKIIKISEYYHKNYSDLKREIDNKLKFGGKIDFSIKDELKEIFE